MHYEPYFTFQPTVPPSPTGPIGTWGGFFPEILDLIAEETGLTITIVPEMAFGIPTW